MSFPAENAASSRGRFHRAMPVVLRAALVLLAVEILVAAYWAGTSLRRGVWESTAPIRYTPDMENAYHWGGRAIDVGYVDLYDRLVAAHPEGTYELDYVPLRLLVMRMWVAWTRDAFPGVTRWANAHAFNRPLLAFNTATEVTGAVAAGLLARLWFLRGGPRGGRQQRDGTGWRGRASWGDVKGWAVALTAALLLWFNPAMIFSGHGRPTWDVWVVPFYLWAVLLACWGRWTFAGAVLATGAMMKGQQLVVAPIFILWPLFTGRWREAIRWTIGFAAGIAVIVSPWMLSRFDATVTPLHRVPDPAAAWWVAGCAVAVMAQRFFRRRSGGARVAVDGPPVAAPPASARAVDVRFAEEATKASPLQELGHAAPRRGRRRHGRVFTSWPMRVGVVLASVALLVWPLLASSSRWMLPTGLFVAVTAVFLARILDRTWAMRLALAVSAGAVLSTPWTFHGSVAWYEVALRYGAEKFDGLEVGGTGSLAGVVAITYRHGAKDVALTMPLPWGPPIDVTWKSLLLTAYGVALVLSAVAMALRDRANDRGFLLAMAAPWVTWFALAPMMHERYLLFGAAAMASAVAVGGGATLLYFTLTLFSFVQAYNQMLSSGDLSRYLAASWPGGAPILRRVTQGSIPGIGWAVILAALILLYLALRGSGRKSGSVIQWISRPVKAKIDP